MNSCEVIFTGFYKTHKKEIMTLYLTPQILVKVMLNYTAEEPQLAHMILDITPFLLDYYGTFDVSCIVIYNEFESFSDDSEVIERTTFDEHTLNQSFIQKFIRIFEVGKYRSLLRRVENGEE